MLTLYARRTKKYIYIVLISDFFSAQYEEKDRRRLSSADDNNNNNNGVPGGAEVGSEFVEENDNTLPDFGEGDTDDFMRLEMERYVSQMYINFLFGSM